MSIRFLSGINVDSNTLFVDDANNRVGIGTASPTQALDVTGRAYISSGASIGTTSTAGTGLTVGGSTVLLSFVEIQQGNLLYLYSSGNTYYSQIYQSGQNLILSPHSNVGIGTTSPGARLHVLNSASPYQVSFQSDTSNVWSMGAGKAGYYQDWFLINSGTSDIIRINNSYTQINNALYAGTNFRIDTNGDAYQLTTGGVALWAATANATYPSYGFYGDTGIGMYRAAADTLAFSTSDTERLRITAAGNVGIGTTSPSDKLTVSVGNVEGIRVQSGNSGFVEIGKTGGARWRWTNEYNSANLFELLVNDLSGSTPGQNVFTVNGANGNIGIGTISPSQKLHINGGNVAIDNSSDVSLIFAKSGASKYEWYLDNASNNFGLYDRGNTSWRFFVTNSGNVGIGTTSPTGKLDVVPTSQNGINIARAGGYPSIYGSNDLVFETDSVFYFGVYTPRLFSVNGSFYTTVSGNVGIGTSNPNAKIHVVGTESRFGGVASGFISVYNATGRSGYIQANGGTDLRIASDSDPMTMYVNGSERMRISSAGALKLNAYGSGSNTGTATQRLAVDASGNVIEIPIGSGPVDGNGTANYVTKWSDADTITNSIIYDNGTNVGIGTTSPGAKLEVNGTIVAGTYNNTRGEITSNGTVREYYSTESNPRWVISRDLVGGGQAGIGFNDTAGTIDATGAAIGGSLLRALGLYTSNGTSLVERMRIADGGNVGIGTTSPSAKLDVNGDINLSNYGSLTGGTAANRMAIIKGTGASGNIEIGGLNNADVIIYTHVNERMRITSSGNVGIGTTSPQRLLSVGGAYGGTSNTESVGLFQSTGNTYITVGTGASSQGGLLFADSGSNNAGAITYSHNTDSMEFGTAGAERMRITAAGNVGIGTTSPTTIFAISQASPIVTINSSDASQFHGIEFRNGNTLDAFIKQLPQTSEFRISNGRGASWGGHITFYTDTVERMRIASTGATRLNAYGSGSFTGTVAYNLAVDSSGNIIETAGGVVDGSGTANYVSKWSDANTLTNSLLYDNGSTISIGLGSTTPSYTNAYGYPQFAIESNAFASSHVFTHNDSNGNYSFFALGKSKGTAAAPTIVENSETIGDFQFWAYDGAAYRNTAFIRNQIDGEPGAGDVPGRLVFGTTNDGSSSASEKMRITSAGNVGIGTTSPAYKLDVNVASNSDALRVQQAGASKFILNGDGVMTWGASAANGVLTWDTNIAYIGGLTNNALGIWAGGSEKVRITTGGNVGIGTTSPSFKLDVNGNTRIGGNSGSNTARLNVGGAANEWVADFQASTTTNQSYGLVVRAGTSSTDFPFYVLDSSSSTSFFAIKGNGNVGIGTTAPGAKLEVVAGNTTSISVRSGNSGQYSILSVGRTSSDIIIASAASSGQFWTGSVAGDGWVGSTNGTLSLGNDTTGVANLTIKSGNVGIGTTSPANKLVAVADATFNGENTYAIAAASLTDVAYKTIVGYDYANDVGVISAVRTGIGWKNLSILPVGNTNLGVGTISPSERLHVSGNIRVTGAYYDSNNSAGSSGQVLSSTGSGTAWVNQGEATATSLYDLLPAARTTYAWSVQLTAGTWADIFSSNTVLSNGTWMVQVYVDDFAVGGQQYQETYSGIMSWGSASSTNETGPEAISEIILHRSGHAANTGNFYLRTVERASSTLLLQGMSNQTYSAASTINFKFVKIF